MDKDKKTLFISFSLFCLFLNKVDDWMGLLMIPRGLGSHTSFRGVPVYKILDKSCFFE